MRAVVGGVIAAAGPCHTFGSVEAAGSRTASPGTAGMLVQSACACALFDAFVLTTF